MRSSDFTAWVPSPTAATLHAVHYLEVDAFAAQNGLTRCADPVVVDPILEIPLAVDPAWSDEDKRREVDNTVQSILGYVVRWVDQGIGCSKVPVDAQNAADPLYEKLIGPDGPGLAFQAARDLILEGASQPNRYTEHILYPARRAKKTVTPPLK
jgi:malate synthase